VKVIPVPPVANGGAVSEGSIPQLDRKAGSGPRRRQWRRRSMAFSETVKDQAYRRSGGRCECNRQHAGATAPHHGGRCPNTFGRNGSWHAHHRTAVAAGGSDDLSNCEVLCIPCHQLTLTYGNR
jgi:5-methylcytosine-specific restriction endonuclease McrA